MMKQKRTFALLLLLALFGLLAVACIPQKPATLTGADGASNQGDSSADSSVSPDSADLNTQPDLATRDTNLVDVTQDTNLVDVTQDTVTGDTGGEDLHPDLFVDTDTHTATGDLVDSKVTDLASTGDTADVALADKSTGSDLVLLDKLINSDGSDAELDAADQADLPPVTQPNYSEGILGDLPPGTYGVLGSVEVRNDLVISRREVAFSGIPLGKDENVLDTSRLVLVDEENRHVQAQFTVLSRWNIPYGAPLATSTRPIRWLQISIPLVIPANTTRTFQVLHFDAKPADATDPLAVTIATEGEGYKVTTGAAEFILNPYNPALLERITLDIDQSGKSTVVYQHTQGAGPKLILPGDKVYSTAAFYDKNTGDTVLVDASPDNPTLPDFTIVERGPAKVVVKLRGHFKHADLVALCPNKPFPWSDNGPFGFTVVMTFFRGSPFIDLRVNMRNECGSFQDDGDTINESFTVQQLSWELPLSIDPNKQYFRGPDQTPKTLTNFNGVISVVQKKGEIDDQSKKWERRAAVILDTGSPSETESGETLPNPYLGLADADYIATIQMPWMSYREPQALVADNSTLSLRFVSEPLVLGEAKAIWNHALIAFFPRDKEADLHTAMDKTMVYLKRGLLVRRPLVDFNKTKVLPSLGRDDIPRSKVKQLYESSIGRMHENTLGWPIAVSPSKIGQFKVFLTFGSQLWPDIQQFSEELPIYTTPAGNAADLNIGDPLTNELMEYLRTGHPKWLWDFALPQANLLMFTAWYNTGDTERWINGFGADRYGTGEGLWHRGNEFSPDFGITENHGIQFAYLLRPNPIMIDRFAQAGVTADQFLGRVEAQRAWFTKLSFHEVGPSEAPGVTLVQQLTALQNCAEFVPGSRGQRCADALAYYLNEIKTDNLRGGLTCSGDPAPTTTCQVDNLPLLAYMMWLPFYRQIGIDPDDGAVWKDMLLGTINRYINDGGFTQNPVGSIDESGEWKSRLTCTLDNGNPTVCTPSVVHTIHPDMKLALLSLPLIARQLDPGLTSYCTLVKSAIEGDLLYSDWLSIYPDTGFGWNEGTAGLMNGVVFTVGGWDECSK